MNARSFRGGASAPAPGLRAPGSGLPEPRFALAAAACTTARLSPEPRGPGRRSQGAPSEAPREGGRERGAGSRPGRGPGWQGWQGGWERTLRETGVGGDGLGSPRFLVRVRRSQVANLVRLRGEAVARHRAEAEKDAICGMGPEVLVLAPWAESCVADLFRHSIGCHLR